MSLRIDLRQGRAMAIQESRVGRGLSFLGQLWRLTVPYWRSEERWQARSLLAAVVALALGLVFIDVPLSQANRELYNSLDQRAFAAVGEVLIRFSLLASL